MGSYVFSFICFLFNMACCFQRQFWQIQYPFLMLRSWVCQSQILVPKTLRTYQIFALLVALMFSHYNWIVHLGTIYYLRLMSHEVYHCEVVIEQWIKSSTRKVNVESCLCRDFLSYHWNRNVIAVRGISQNELHYLC